MRKKKDLPLVILKALEPFVKLQGKKFEIIESKESLISVKDQDPDSKFYFTIEKYQKNNNNKYLIQIMMSPRNQNENGDYRSTIYDSELGETFNKWLKLLDEYESVNSFFDDPILKSFKEEFYAEFEVIDYDSDIRPFSSKQILFLDDYLEEVDRKLQDFITGSNSLKIKDIQADIINLRENLTTKSKKWVIIKLAEIWAKAAKQGTRFIKEFLTESKREVIKKGVKGFMNILEENITEILS